MQEPFPLVPLPSSPLAPGAVVGRDQTIVSALAQLRAGNNLLLTDPRRMGKTALLGRLCHEPGSHALAVLIDYEGVATTEDFLLRTIAGLRSHQGIGTKVAGVAKAFFNGFDAELGPIKVKAAFAHRAPETLLLEVFAGVNAALAAGEMLIVAMDEVPLAVDNIASKQGPESAGQILQTLRRIRQTQPSAIRWIVTGSVGFHHVIRRAGVTEGLINDLVNLPLGPWRLPMGSSWLAVCSSASIGTGVRGRSKPWCAGVGQSRS